ncbi:hypothetical protein V1264_014417 [Littorina saxatilis]|uniref:C-type lectin n=1 Tax=Littorina saxatilis TaxID=31220 RepID=A0AAN9GIY9_9CAEN
MEKVLSVLALSLLWHWKCVAVEMPAHTTWTVFTAGKTWSEAELLCEMRGGYLANLNTTFKNQVFEHLLGKEPWNSAVDHGTTVGLHNTNNEASDPHLWLPDCTTNNITYSYSFTFNGGCLSKGQSGNWDITCDYDNEFACERHWGYTCPYDTIQGTKAGRNISSIQSQAFSDRDCQELCDQRGVECWAAARDGADTCYLYQGSSPFAFDDGVETVTDSSFTMFIKRCYEGLVDENTYDWLQVTSDLPLSVCHDSDPGGRVYTLVKEAKSWGSARAHCSGIGQTLAGSRTAMDRQTIQDVIQEM